MKSRYKYYWFHLLLLFLIACIVTYPAFVGHRIFWTYDGSVFLGRIEQVYQSLTHFRLPTPISYIGMDHKLGAMNAMYPWLTSLIFVVPMYFVKNKILCLVIGFVILNLFTALNFYV